MKAAACADVRQVTGGLLSPLLSPGCERLRQRRWISPAVGKVTCIRGDSGHPRKHGVADLDIEHAVRNAIRVIGQVIETSTSALTAQAGSSRSSF